MHKAGCTGKKVFLNFTHAATAAKRRNRHDQAHLEAYHCIACNNFHVGEARSYKQGNEKRRSVAEMRHEEGESV